MPVSPIYVLAENPHTSTALLASLKRRGLIPTSTQTFAAADFYKIVDDEIQTYIVPLLMSVREEYLVANYDVTIEDGVTEYELPPNAIGGKLRDLQISDGNGGFTSMPRLEPEIAAERSSTSYSLCFYLRGDRVVLVGTPTSTTLRMVYYRRPNRIVATTSCVRLEDTDINDDVELLTVINDGDYDIVQALYNVNDTVPDTFVEGVDMDIIRGRPGFGCIATDSTLAFTDADTGLISLTAIYPAPTSLGDVVAGDYVCLAGESPIPQIPVELHPLLAQRATATVLQALGDDKAKAAYEVAADMEKRVLKLITPRVEGASRFISNKYGVGRGRPYRRG